MTAQPNLRFEATFFTPTYGKTRKLELVLHRIVNETERHYQERFADIVSYKNGVLADIERIRRVQQTLLDQGYGLSNVCLTDVGPLYDPAETI